MPNCSVTTIAPMLKTLSKLHEEKKFFKSKFILEKFTKIINEDSFINKVINEEKYKHIVYKGNNLNEIKNRKKNNKMKGIGHNVLKLNKNYNLIKTKLTLPTILDINDSNYNYEKYKEKEINKIKNIRINYIKQGEKILNKLFNVKCLKNENRNNKIFKCLINPDIKNLIEKTNERKVGKIIFNDLNDEGKILKVNLILNENELKEINKTFLY